MNSRHLQLHTHKTQTSRGRVRRTGNREVTGFLGNRALEISFFKKNGHSRYKKKHRNQWAPQRPGLPENRCLAMNFNSYRVYDKKKNKQKNKHVFDENYKRLSRESAPNKQIVRQIEKLRSFCLRYAVSARYRLCLWKVILGVLPANQNSHEFVMTQRREQYSDLHHALEVLRRITPETPQAEVFLKMFLIEEGLLPFDETNLLHIPENKAFVAIASAISSLAEDSVEAYWVTTKFYRFFKRYKEAIPKLPALTVMALKKEDSDQKLWLHLQKHDIWSELPLVDWFSCCFAGILPDYSFERVGDIVIGGSSMILVYVTVAMFLTFRRPLLSMTSKGEMLNYLSTISEDSGDILVSKAIEMWEKNGYHLSKSESPGPMSRLPT